MRGDLEQDLEGGVSPGVKGPLRAEEGSEGPRWSLAIRSG